MEYTDQEIIEMMKQNREHGAVALLEKYTGLVWSVCARRLEDPEDICECVNTAFAEFCAGFDRFCTEKDSNEKAPMSLKGYLCTIANRKAINRYRSNSRRIRAEEAAMREQETLQETQDKEHMRNELEDALECLEPLDSQIVRMKYYGGMSYQEIAGQLEMNYETVKKRGQRSLKKLWKILVFGLILLLLTACAVALYRRFQFVDGVGFNWKQESPVYRLTYVSPACTVDDITFSVKDAVYQDGLLYLAFSVRYQTAEDDISKRQQLYSYFAKLAINGEPAKFDGSSWETYKSTESIMEIQCCWLPENKKEPLSLEISLTNSNETKPALMFSLELSKVSEQEDASALGTLLLFEDTGFLVTPGIKEEEGTEFSLYTLNGGLKEGAYRFSPLLVNNLKGTDGRAPEKVTLTAEDGTIHESIGIQGRCIAEMNLISLRFPQVEPGEYLLSIPYLCLDGTQQSETAFLRLPTEPGESLPCNETILFPDGTGIHLTSITAELYEAGETIQINSDICFMEEHGWWYRLEFEPVSKGDLLFCVAAAETMFFFRELSPDEQESVLDAAEESLPEGFGPVFLGGCSLVNGEIYLDAECDEQPVWVRLTLTEPVYLMERRLERKVLVK